MQKPIPNIDPRISGDQPTQDNCNLSGNPSYLSLIYECSSLSALALADSILAKIAHYLPITYNPTKKLCKALQVSIAALLLIETKERKTYGYHQMNPRSFRCGQIGYEPFVKIVNAMEAAGYVIRELGFKRFGKDGASQATRFKASSKLIEAAASHGIDGSNWDAHFKRLPRPEAIANPIQLRKARFYNVPAEPLQVDNNLSIVRSLAQPINDLNLYFHRQNIEPDCHYAYIRLFAKFDKGESLYDKAGRIYSIGEGSYQQKKNRDRKLIKINGESVVEVDISASHLTIYHALCGVDITTFEDPYQIEGIHRIYVKACVNNALGNSAFHKFWPEKTITKFKDDKRLFVNGSIDILPIEFVVSKILERFPLLKTLKGTLIGWAELQYAESCIILETMHQLALEHDVPALPLHDSVIVPASQQALAEKILSESFFKHVGVRPRIKIG